MEHISVIDKYLLNYAEPEVRAVAAMGYHFRQALIIPAYNEHENVIEILESICEKNILVVLVVNAKTDSKQEVLDTNNQLLRTVRKKYFEIWRSKQGQGISLHQLPNCTLLLIDKSSGQLKLPEKSGVGLARKIAADVVLQLIRNKEISSSWIHSTDADVKLPEDYFAQIEKISKSAVAAIYPYEHFPINDNEAHQQAVFLYELSLRHYVIGLKHAGSPYAFHTIGSTIAIKADSYAAVRGFPKREAGEDFYLLNKLAKLGPIEHLRGKPIKIAGRVSDRVPFGTGRAVEKIQQLEKPLEQYEFYHPSIFGMLQFWLNELKNLTPTSNLQKFEKTIRQKAKYPQLITGLEKLGAFKAIKNILSQTNRNGSAVKQLHTWFDAFRTLKLIHHIRDHGYKNVKLTELFEHAPYNEYSFAGLENLNTVNHQFIDLEKSI